MPLQFGAMVTYEEIIEIDKTEIEAYRTLGKLTANDDPDKAIEHWEKVKQYKPDDKEASKAIRDLSAASMVHKTEKRKEASGDESFRAMLKDEEESAELEQKQQIIRNDADRKRAIKFKLDEFKKDPSNTRLLREVGVLFQDLKLWNKAEQAFKKALQVNPRDFAAQERVGQLSEVRLNQELEDLKNQLNGDDTTDSELLAKITKKKAEILQFSLQEYKRRVEAHPTDYAVKFKLGCWLKQAKQVDEAIGMFQQAVKDPKHKVSSRKQIGECFVHKELYDMAKSQFVAALQEVGDKESNLWKEINYLLARACEANEEVDEALDHYQEIMAVDIAYEDVSTRVSALRKK
ncbi:MAG TPA: hypothetical protein EYM91_03720 [Acidobacteria bacterium]|nr:hypothetical protein [Acidobacteriota bacterium]